MTLSALVYIPPFDPTDCKQWINLHNVTGIKWIPEDENKASHIIILFIGGYALYLFDRQAHYFKSKLESPHEKDKLSTETNSQTETESHS